MTTPDRSGIGLVGPSSPDKGGIVRHTAELANRLRSTGRLAAFAPWERYRPRGIARRAAPLDAPESMLDVPTSRGPSWDRPSTWARTGDDLGRVADRLLMVVSSPAQLPALLAIQRAFLRQNPTGRAALVVHNVVPHDAGRVGRTLARSLARAGLPLLVHTPSQAALAVRLGADNGALQVARLPYHGPTVTAAPWTGRATPTRSEGDGLRLLFLGFVRPYKGIDVLLQALSISARRHRVVIMGEFWMAPERLRRRIAALDLDDRVELRPGYATDAAVTDALMASDALVLPYRDGTASQLPRVAFSAGVPVIATYVGDLPDQVHHGIDGMVVPPGDPQALAGALDRVSDPGRLDALRGNVRPPDVEREWGAYLAAIDVLLEQDS